MFTDSQGWKRNLCVGAGLKALFTTPEPSLCPCEILCVETSWRVYGRSVQTSEPGLQGEQACRTGMMRHSKRGAQSLLALALSAPSIPGKPLPETAPDIPGACSILLLLAEVKESSEIPGHKARVPMFQAQPHQFLTLMTIGQRDLSYYHRKGRKYRCTATRTHGIMPAFGEVLWWRGKALGWELRFLLEFQFSLFRSSGWARLLWA